MFRDWDFSLYLGYLLKWDFSHQDSLCLFFAVKIVMSSEDHQRFERFTSLGPPRLSSVVDEDSYEFLIYYREKLHNLRSVELYRVAYTINQLIDVATYLWR